MTDILTIEKVSKIYHSRAHSEVAALRDISLTVQAGAFKVIHGASGSGKTTLLLAAGGLLKPDAGTIRVCGQDLYALSPEKRSRFRGGNIGFVFQQFYLIPYLNVLENVLAPTLAVRDADAQKRAKALIETFGLSHRIDHPPSELSTGEKQRVALCRAMLHEPALVLADEPTGNLDTPNTEIVLQHLRDYVQRGGAVLVATHDSRIETDETFTLVDGRLVEQPQPVAAANV